MKIKVTSWGFDKIAQKIELSGEKAAHALAVQVAKDTEQFVPALTGSLANRTKVVGDKIVYPGPYARYLYEGKVMVDTKTGKGPVRIVTKNGSEIFRFPKGATLKATDRPLKFNKSFHKNAQDHWFEASKAMNKEKWLRIAKKLMEDELK